MMRVKNKFIAIWLIALAVKLILSAMIPLSSDEAYYWVWSKNLQLSYYDHPPFVAWLFYLGHFLEGLGQAVRWPGVILSHLTLLVWYLILKIEMPDEKKLTWLDLMLFSVFFGLGSLIITPDLPLIFFWSLGIYFFQKALRQKDLWSYIFFGLSLGLGFCSKYLIVLLPLCAFCYLTFEKKWRDVRWWPFLATLLTGFVFCLPVLIWNEQNDFVSFRFQFEHGLGETKWEPHWTWSYILGQIAIFSPVAVWFAFKKKLSNSLRAFYYFGGGPLLFFLMSSLKGKVEANWSIMAYPSMYVLVAANLENKKILRWITWPVIAITTVLVSSMFLPIKAKLPPKLNEELYYAPVMQEAFERENTFAGTYQMASYIWYTTKKPFYKMPGVSRTDFFDFLPEATVRTDLFYLIKENESELPNWIYERYNVDQVKTMGGKFQLLKLSKK